MPRRPPFVFPLLLALAALAAGPAAGALTGSGSAERAARKVATTSALPTLPSFSELVSLRRYESSLVEVERTRSKEAARLLRRAGGVAIAPRLGVWRLPSRTLLRLYPSFVAAGIVRAVAADRPLEPSGRMTTAVDPLVAQQWWLPAVGANLVTPPGPGKGLAIVDSGVDMTHPEFAGRPSTILLNAQRVLAGSGEHHGTAVASTAAAPSNGIGMEGLYPQAALHISDASPNRPGMTVGDEIAGINAAISRRASVINLSLGSDDYNSLEERAIFAAFGAGVLIVASAGNEFEDGNPAEYPASLKHVLTIAATDAANESSDFSNRSPAVDLAAPGEQIVAAVPTWYSSTGYVQINGTSFSSPIVAAAAAWVWTVRPNLDVTQVFDLMRFNAKDVWTPGFDSDTGFGLLDIPKALSATPPTSDGQEPNDDVFHVKANGLFRRAARPLTDKSRASANLSARLDSTEDPEDVYRVWVPGKRKVTIRIRGSADVDLEAWRSGTPSVLARGAQRKRYLIAGSYKRATAIDTVSISNSGRTGTFIYVDVFLPKDGPGSASYTGTIRTAR